MIDHVVLATPDLEATIGELTERFGVAPSIGGPHVGLGTRNVLYSLGSDSYLEVIGPDREQPTPDGPRPLGVDEVDRATVYTWCAKSTDLTALVARSKVAGRTVRGPVPMARQAPHGLLQWACAFPDETCGGLVPFFIDWGPTTHPAATSVQGLRLRRLVAGHPNPELVTAAWATFGVALDIEPADHPSLRLVVDSPRGAVEL